MTYPWRTPERPLDPFRELQTLRSELGRLVGAALDRGRGGFADVDLEQTDDGWRVVARLPGVAPEELAVELEGDELCIRARSEEEVNADQGMPGTGSKERTFDYRISLPRGVDTERIDAVMDHGLLIVSLPRRGQAARRSIVIGRGSLDAGRTIAGTTDVGSGGARKAAHSPDPAADREMHRPDIATGDIAPQAG
jgi:HSP20 family protein